MIKKGLILPTIAYFFILLIGSSLIIAIDQFIKHKIRFGSGFYVCNYGISFNLKLQPPVFWFIFIVFLLLISSYFIFLLKNSSLTPLLLLLFILILGGAISNGVDRLSSKCVIDFLSINLSFFPLFNFADIFIFIGVSLFLFLFLNKNRAGL